MAMVCTTITEWIEEKISKPIEQWEEERYRECKKRPWWHPIRWLCWFVTRLVKVIRWIVVTVVTAVITVVCHAIANILQMFLDLLIFFGSLLAALFGWDKCRLQTALAHLGNAVIGVLTFVGDVLLRPIIQRIQLYRLSNYVEEQIDKIYGSRPEIADALKERFSVNFGSFGYRVTCRVYRMYVDSSTDSPLEPGVPNLYALHRDKLVNLYELAGFDRDCAIFSKAGWYQPRHSAVIYPQAGRTVNLTRNDLTTYIESAGQRGPRFRIYSISSWNLGMRERAGSEKSRQLGLKIEFDREDKEVIDPQFINYNRTPINPATPEPLVDCATKNKGQTDYLICELGRHPKSEFKCCTYGQQSQMIAGSLDLARADLCSPAAVAVFWFTDRHTRGLASNLFGTTHCGDRNLSASIASGVSFIDDIPDEVRKYVLIHELGHYYGLCHVDGLDRIMVPGTDEGKLLTWWAIPNSLVHGGPRFIFREAQRVWDFILANFPLSCFGIEDDVILDVSEARLVGSAQ